MLSFQHQNEVKIWSLVTGKELGFLGFLGFLLCSWSCPTTLTISSDNKKIITGCHNVIIQIYKFRLRWRLHFNGDQQEGRIISAHGQKTYSKVTSI
ncbi:MAG: hypothetical protein ACKPFA_06935, partial [Dolichospermum sp.]